MPQHIIEIGPRVPRAPYTGLAGFGRLVLRVLGWRLELRVPDRPRLVLAVLPHTSNWEFVVGLAAIFASGLRLSWWVKHTVVRWPFRRLLLSLGAIPVDRRSPHGLVGQTVAAFEARDAMILGVAPEGTRTRVDSLRRGFWHVAVEAQVPILLVTFDYARRVLATGPLVEPTGDYEADLAPLLAGANAVTPKRPAEWGGTA